MATLSKLVTCIEYGPLRVKGTEDDFLTFRIEVFKELDSPKQYYPCVWTKESYRVQACFPQTPTGDPKDPPCDITLLAEEHTLGCAHIRCESEAQVIDRVRHLLMEVFEEPGPG